jgi:hypothetical protein
MGNSVICDNIHETGRHQVKWKKLGTQWQMFHDLTCMWNWKADKFKKVESRMVITRGWTQVWVSHGIKE